MLIRLWITVYDFIIESIVLEGKHCKRKLIELNDDIQLLNDDDEWNDEMVID